MAKKKEDAFTTELRKLLGLKRLVLGTDVTLKKLASGNISRVFVTKNCPTKTLAEIEAKCAEQHAELVQVAQHNDEFGALCKKPFAVSVVGVLR